MLHLYIVTICAICASIHLSLSQTSGCLEPQLQTDGRCVVGFIGPIERRPDVHVQHTSIGSSMGMHISNIFLYSTLETSTTWHVTVSLCSTRYCATRVQDDHAAMEALTMPFNLSWRSSPGCPVMPAATVVRPSADRHMHVICSSGPPPACPAAVA